MASAHVCSTEKQTRPGKGFFFPTHQRGKFKETSTKQGTMIVLMIQIDVADDGDNRQCVFVPWLLRSQQCFPS